MKVWKGQAPKHTVAIKLDGIQAALKDGSVVSRSGKPLRNIDPAFLEHGKKYEVYLGSFKETVSVLRTLDHERKVRKDELYEIYPDTDQRLLLPLDCDIEAEFFRIVSDGGEGLVIDQKFKKKKIVTYDVTVIGVIPGKRKNTGKMGSLLTEMGKVGVGFTDKEREMEWHPGDMIEVACMELTEKGKFRKPRFVRNRWDK